MTRYIIILSLICFSFIDKPKKDKQLFIEIRGKKQYYLSKGNGEPVIVFITGLGPTMDDFEVLQNNLCKTNRVICYDRAGIGNSESYNNERTLENISSELNELLDAIGLKRPFLLVGHSRGGVIARYFVDKYPGKVIGLVLIDPAIPEHKWLKRQLRTEPEKITFDKYYESFCTDSINYTKTIRNEFIHTYKNDSADVFGKGFSQSIPITLIASNKVSNIKYNAEEVKIKVEIIKSYLKLNPNINLIFTDKAGHFIHDDQPKLIIKEITKMLSKLPSNK
jgi:pimeloyl-ACP methyl ester carboxylesterase